MKEDKENITEDAFNLSEGQTETNMKSNGADDVIHDEDIPVIAIDTSPQD